MCLSVTDWRIFYFIKSIPAVGSLDSCSRYAFYLIFRLEFLLEHEFWREFARDLEFYVVCKPAFDDIAELFVVVFNHCRKHIETYCIGFVIQGYLNSVLFVCMERAQCDKLV